MTDVRGLRVRRLTASAARSRTIVVPLDADIACVAPSPLCFDSWQKQHDAMGQFRTLAVEALILVSANHASKREFPAQSIRLLVEARNEVLPIL
jgi:hypothetical protein